MDIEKWRERLRELVEEMRRLHEPPEDLADAERATWAPDDEALARFEELDTEATELRTKIEDYEKRAAKLAKASAAARVGGDDADGNRGGFDPPNVNRGGDPYDLDSLGFNPSVNNLRARIETALERDSVTPDKVKEAAMTTLRTVRGGPSAKRAASMLYLATGSEAYRSAFAKMMTGQGAALLSEQERMAVERAQSLTDAAGGFAVPFTLDPTIIFTNESAINPIRRIARVVQTVTDQWQGVTGGAASASWDAEEAEVSDDSIALADVPIPVHKMQVFVPFSVEIQGDWADIDGDLRTAMMEGRDELEATTHVAGTGAGQPTGFQTALVAAGAPPLIDSAVAATFGSADVYALQNNLPPRHRQAGPIWGMDVATANSIRQFDTGGGGEFWASLAQGAPPDLLNWDWEEISAMDSTADFGAAGTYYPLVTGNWSRYIVVDRIGMQMELVPHLFGANRRPTGQRGLWGWLRSGANVADTNAFRMLRVVIP